MVNSLVKKALGPKSRLSQKILLISFVLAVIIGYWFYAQRSLNFQAYQPNTLPEGIKITRHEVTITSGQVHKHKQVTYYTNTPDFYIAEQKSSPQDYAQTTYSCAAKPSNATCFTYSSKSHQAFEVQTAAYGNSDASYQTISWLRGNTRFWISLENDQALKYPPESWGNIIDSFSPINYPNEHIKKVTINGA